MLWSDFLAQQRRELEEPSATVWADESILHWTNECAYDIARLAKPLRDEQYETAVIGQGNYALPAQESKGIEVYFDDVRLMRLDYSDFATLDSFDDTGTPVYYIVDDESIQLIPAPDSAGTIRYFRFYLPTPIASVDSTDEMPFSSNYNTAIGYYVKAHAYMQVADWTSSNEYANRYAAEVDKIRTHETSKALSGRSPREVW